jgi:hypothetical protein
MKKELLKLLENEKLKKDSDSLTYAFSTLSESLLDFVKN